MSAQSIAVVERVSPSFSKDRLAHLWIVTRAASAVTDAVWTVAIAWAAVQAGSAAAAGVVVAAGTIPRALFLLLGGAFADRFDARRVLATATVGRLIVLGALVVIAVSSEISYALLIGVAVVLGACDAIYEPAAVTIPRQLVHPTDLAKYASVYQTASRVGGIVGSAVGGIVVARWAIEGAAVANILAFGAVLAVVTLGLRFRYPIDRTPSGSTLRSVVDGIAHVREDSVTGALVLSQVLMNVFIVPALGLGVALRTAELGRGPDIVGYVGMVVGVGAAAGALVTVWFKPPRPAKLAYLLFAVEGLGIVGLGLGGVTGMLVGGCIMGVCAGIGSSLFAGVLISYIDGAYLGRMFSLINMGDECLIPLGTVAFGAIAGIGSVSWTFVGFGLALVITMCIPLANGTLRGISMH